MAVPGREWGRIQVTVPNSARRSMHAAWGKGEESKSRRSDACSTARKGEILSAKDGFPSLSFKHSG